MAYTNDWSDLVPIDHTKFKSAPGALRQARADLSDRLKNLFYGFIAGEVQTDEGIKNLPFRYQAADPAASANKVKVYAKQWSDGTTNKAELFMISEDGVTQQLTARGKWVGGGYKEIKMTAGTQAEITTKWPGWQICDGTNGTPDLRKRMVVSTDNATDPGVVAGDAYVGPHVHTDAGHTHPQVAHQHTLHVNDAGGGRLVLETADASALNTTNYTFADGATTTGSGTASIQTKGTAVFYALCFIMKL